MAERISPAIPRAGHKMTVNATRPLRVVPTPGPFRGRGHHYLDPGDSLAWVSSADQADCAIFPFDTFRTLEHRQELDLLREAISSNHQDLGLRTLVLLYSDHQKPVRPILGEGAVVIRSSLLRSTADPFEFGCPALISEDDFEGFAPPSWSTVPRVGFVGQSQPVAHHELLKDPSALNAARIGHRPMRDEEQEPFPAPINIGLVLRHKVLEAVGNSQKIEARLVTRDRYHGFYDPQQRQQMRQQYLDTMEWSQYGLCIRGHGNYSIRLFETMASGRIPVILDSNMTMPAGDMIPWNDLGLWFSMDELGELAPRMRAFHDQLGPEGVIQLSKQVRQYWEEFLSLRGYRRYLADHVRQLVGQAQP